MLLAIDIGNTNIVLGVHHQAEWRQQWRVQTNNKRMADEYAVLFAQLFQQAHLTYASFTQIVIGSVVPQLTHVLAGMLQQHTQLAPIIVHHAQQPYITVCTDPPEKTGADLIANAIAAFARFKTDCLVVDFGTATTVSAIAQPGKFLGCAIAPGLHTICDALIEKTSQLPAIVLKAPPSVIGSNTVHAMQSGLILGHICMVEGLVERMRKQLGAGTKVIATGGLATTLAPLTTVFDVVDEWLTLDGLRWIAEAGNNGLAT